MQTVDSKLWGFAIRCRAIGAPAIILIFFLIVPMAQAADGDVDLTFGDIFLSRERAGKVMTDFNHSTDLANAVAVQADGKLVVVGTTYINNDYTNEDFAVARYNLNGTLDKTFGVAKYKPIFPVWLRWPHPWSSNLMAKSWSQAAPFCFLPSPAISKWSALTRTDRSIRPLAKAAS
jgi:Domain of unknown function (DUF5122) beta-propeller